MITSSHIIYSWAVAKYLDQSTNQEPATKTHQRTYPFILGALVPDIAIFIFFIIYGLLLNYPGATMWDELYFTSPWSIVFTLSHSFILWPLVVLLATWRRSVFWQSLGLSALLHVVIDFFVHSADAYRHFWPVTDWRFISPVSYWNTAEFGTVVGIVDAIVVIMLLTYQFTRCTELSKRALLLAAGIFYVSLLLRLVVI